MIAMEVNVGETLAGRTTVHTREMIYVAIQADDNVVRHPVVITTVIIDVVRNMKKSLRFVATPPELNL